MLRQKNFLRKSKFISGVQLKTGQYSTEVNLPKQADVVVVGKYTLI